MLFFCHWNNCNYEKLCTSQKQWTSMVFFLIKTTWMAYKFRTMTWGINAMLLERTWWKLDVQLLRNRIKKIDFETLFATAMVLKVDIKNGLNGDVLNEKNTTCWCSADKQTLLLRWSKKNDMNPTSTCQDCNENYFIYYQCLVFVNVLGSHRTTFIK